MINWFTVGAQIVNFLILVGLLKHFLYGPIVKAMDERQETIRKRLQEADEKRNQAEKEASNYREKSKDIDRRKQDMLDDARQAAKEERKERISKAREDADALSEEWRKAVERERDSFFDDLRQRLSRDAVTIARKALADLAGARVEDLMIDTFISRLQDIEDDERDALKAAIEGEDGGATVRTGVELSDDDRTRLAQAIREGIGADASIEFERTEHVVAGIELSAAGRKVAWTVAQYLDDAAREIEEALDAANRGSDSSEASSDKPPDKQEEETEQKQEDDDDA